MAIALSKTLQKGSRPLVRHIVDTLEPDLAICRCSLPQPIIFLTSHNCTDDLLCQPFCAERET